MNQVHRGSGKERSVSSCLVKENNIVLQCKLCCFFLMVTCQAYERGTV
jgi:hypothetical protein